MYTIKLTTEQLTYVANILGRCPYGEVQLLIASLQTQISEQDKLKGVSGEIQG